MDTVYTAKDGDMLDAVCFKYYGKTGGGIVEYVLAYNQNLADDGLTLKAGTQLILPPIDDIATSNVVSLWDL